LGRTNKGTIHRKSIGDPHKSTIFLIEEINSHLRPTARLR